MTHMLTRHCSAQAVVDSGLTSSRGPLARDWLGAMPAGLDPRQLQRTCTGKSASWWVVHLRGTAGCGRGRLGPASNDGPFVYLSVSIIRLSSRHHSDHTKSTHNHRLTHSSL